MKTRGPSPEDPEGTPFDLAVWSELGKPQKKIFFEALEKNPPPKKCGTKLEGGGGRCKAFVAGPLKKRTFIFLRLPLAYNISTMTLLWISLFLPNNSSLFNFECFLR